MRTSDGAKRVPPVQRASGGRRCTMRIVKDAVGAMVLAYESEPPGGGPRTLVLESSAGRFRLEQYPIDWRRLSDKDLLALVGV